MAEAVKGRGDLAVHRWVLEQTLQAARKARRDREIQRAKRILAGIDRRLARQRDN